VYANESLRFAVDERESMKEEMNNAEKKFNRAQECAKEIEDLVKKIRDYIAEEGILSKDLLDQVEPYDTRTRTLFF
jgi:hypothetical protein